MTRDTVRVAGSRGPGTASTTAEEISAGAAPQATSENFPVALRFLPERYRRHLAAVYAFARTVDDIGDRAPAPQRLALLDEVAADLGRLWAAVAGGRDEGGQDLGRQDAGGPRLAVIRGLAPTVAECSTPSGLFLDLVEANRRDQLVTRYQTYEDLLGYCQLSANPVGRLVLHIFGAASAERGELSDRVCSALQIAEHLQDVAEDLRAGRIYLPAEDMTRFGVSEGDLAAPSAGPAVRALIGFERRRAAALLDEGARVIGGLRGAARVAVAGYVAGGRAALAAIEAAGDDVLAATPRPRRARLLAELLRAYGRGR